jgi:hypothetical protein
LGLEYIFGLKHAFWDSVKVRQGDGLSGCWEPKEESTKLVSIYVFVTRRNDPLDETGPAITEDEWLKLVRDDPDLSKEEPPDRFPRDNTSYAAWKNYPGGYTAWFGLAGGNIEIKGIDEALLGKLRSFAKALNARIVSEEGEEFN